MKKYFFCACFLVFSSYVSFAQSSPIGGDAQVKVIKVKKKKEKKVKAVKERNGTYLYNANDLVFSLILGRGQFASPISAPRTNTGNVSNQAPNTNILSGNSNSFVNMAGVEARYFLNSKIGLRLSAGIIFNNTPSQESIDGISDQQIPEISVVNDDERLDINIIPGVEYHFGVKSKRLSPYLGLSTPFIYGKHSNFNPDPDGDVFGTRHATVFGIGGQIFSGIDYYFNDDIYIGIQINVAGSTYTRVEKSAGEGVDLSRADSVQANFLTQPVFKIGFRL